MAVTAGYGSTGRTVPIPPPAGAPGAVAAPRLADGVELLGEYQDSGYRQPPSLARRPDGQVIQMSPLLYRVTCRIDGSRDPAAIAELVSEDLGRSLTADQVQHLIRSKLLPLGIVADQGAPAVPPTANPLLALRARGTLLPERAANAAGVLLRPLFRGPWSLPWWPASWPWTTGCSSPMGWVGAFSRSCATRWTCSSCWAFR
jgi:putative peptide zinc metalloprotease protein